MDEPGQAPTPIPTMPEPVVQDAAELEPGTGAAEAGGTEIGAWEGAGPDGYGAWEAGAPGAWEGLAPPGNEETCGPGPPGEVLLLPVESQKRPKQLQNKPASVTVAMARNRIETSRNNP